MKPCLTLRLKEALSFLPSELIANIETEEQLEEIANTCETEKQHEETVDTF